MQKNTVISVIISVAIISATLYVVSEKPVSPESGSSSQLQNIEIKDGIQFATITALGGYSPSVSVVQPNLPTKLIVKTSGTYDCSASLMIRSVGFQKVLQPTGEEMIDLGTLKSGETIQGLCGMGMYSFQIKSS